MIELVDPVDVEVAASAVPAAVSNTSNSVAFELMLENLFLSELLQEMWFARGQVVDVLHSPVDAYGYDLVLQCGGVTRHVQLKTERLTGRDRHLQTQHAPLQPASGVCRRARIGTCRPEPPASTLNLSLVRRGPHEPIPKLGEKIAKHTKGDSQGIKKEKPLHRVIALGKFSKVSSMTDIAMLLFGPADSSNDS